MMDEDKKKRLDEDKKLLKRIKKKKSLPSITVSKGKDGLGLGHSLKCYKTRK